MKKAFLVDFSLRTRVVVDIPERTKPDDKVKEAAIAKILADPKSYLEDNLEDIFYDIECPYPCGKEEENEKKADEWFSQADFKTMEEIFELRHEDFNSEDGYQDFVDECENRWDSLDSTTRVEFFIKYS